MVTARSKLKLALNLGPGVLDYIVGLCPHEFVRLRSPLMRKLMPPRISLARVAAMAGIAPEELVRGVYAAAGLPLPEGVDDAPAESLPANPTAPPDWCVAPADTLDLLASDDRLDADPLPPILRAVKALGPGQVLRIKHRWEPTPLYDIWARKGLSYYSERVEADEWHIFVRGA